MENLFESGYERTPQILKEVYRYICFRRPVHIVIYAVVGVITLWNIVASIWFWEFALAPFTPVAYCLLFLLIQFIVYKRNVSVCLDRDREQHGPEPLNIRTVVSEEGIRCTYGENKVNAIPVSSIKKVYQTKNLIILLTKAQLMLIFDRRKFTVGTPEDFLAYLRSKGLKV